jgi:aldehyde oxidoreductase
MPGAGQSRERAIKMILRVNGEEYQVNASPVARLADVIREELGLTGTKVGCNSGDCGACTVLMDGKQVCACLVAVGRAAGADILTVEGLAKDGQLNSLQKSMHFFGAAQCGICTPGILMAATDLLKNNPSPNVDEIQNALGGVLCRCTGYQKIIQAILNINQPEISNVLEPKPRSAVGARVLKTDGVQKLTGEEKFGDDSAPKDALWIRAIRSPYWNAEFKLGDLENFKRNYPGLSDILTEVDIPGNNGYGIYPDVKDQPALAIKSVKYRGEPVLALVGNYETIYRIQDQDLPITWTEFPALSGFDAPLDPDAPEIHPGNSRNVLASGRVQRGNASRAIKDSPIRAEGNFTTGFVEHAYIEPEAGWAQRVGNRLEIHATTQSPYMDRDEIAQLIGIPKENVRIIPTACGGGFGGKLDLTVQLFLSIAAWKLNKPVRMVYDRKESMAATTKRHPSRIIARYGCDENGFLTGFEFTGDFNTGAYISWGLTVKDRVPIHASGPYLVPSVHSRSRAIFSNDPVAGAFRGFGVPQAAIAHEALIDEMAEQTGIDPLEFRHQNAIRKGQTTNTSQELQSAGLDKCLEALRPGWRKNRAEAEAYNKKAVGPIRRGVGIGCMWYGCGNTSLSNPSTMRIGISSQGLIRLYSGAQDIGQGTNTTMVQAAADALGVPMRDIHLVWGDTDKTPDSGKSSASRQAYVSGNATKSAGENLRGQILRLANAGYDAKIELQGSKLLVHDQSVTHEINLSSLPAEDSGDVFIGEGYFDPPVTNLDKHGQGNPYGTYGFAAQTAYVEVDCELGLVKVISLEAAHDVGQAINPIQVEGQIEGGTAQGLGFALMEEYIPGKTENLHDYLIPTIGDIPPIKIFIVEDPEPTGPWGAKGIGEPALCATAPAIYGGIYHATGVRIRQTPCTPDRLKEAIKLKAYEGSGQNRAG